jgi:L-alanine-DL-glutamate epimerase-like enolase superfamily enzyme
MIRRSRIPIDALAVSAFRIPTDRPESDGTLSWTSTTLVVVRARGGGETGIGYTYADVATAVLIRERLAEVVAGGDAMSIEASWQAMVRSVRNLGRPGIASMAISAVDNALWDLKCRLLGVPLAALLGRARPAVPVYGSGGFTSYTICELQDQLGAWAAAGFRSVKMKVGREPGRDVERVASTREAIGPDTELFVDANSAWATRAEALFFAERFAPFGVTWLEEPLRPESLNELRRLRGRLPPGMDLADGEYGYDLDYFRRLLASGAVDVAQADVTRCGGVTGFLKVAALCEAAGTPLSSHCAPALHAPLACAAAPVRHVEWFHDHVRIERMLFDGAPVPRDGLLRADTGRPGFGVELKERDAERYAA